MLKANLTPQMSEEEIRVAKKWWGDDFENHPVFQTLYQDFLENGNEKTFQEFCANRLLPF